VGWLVVGCNGACRWVGWWWVVMERATCGPHLLLYTWICIVGMLTGTASHCMLWVGECDGHTGSSLA
jgi:hypothetical protein